ncbi:MAG: GTPase Era [Burkholderiales bacterium]|nr:GTPase Era [Burkholderiales bacterium]
MNSKDNHRRCGLVALVGRPNVGKSTLLNRLIDTKISITSSKAQTTRQRVRGMLTEGDDQFIFVDTPGFQTRYRSALNAQMNQIVRNALDEVDVVVAVFDAKPLNDADEQIVHLLPRSKNVIAAVNKIDMMQDKSRLLLLLNQLAKRFSFSALVPLSATKGWQVEALKREIAARLPENAWLYDENEITDKDERFLAAELIREKIFRLLGDEIPYSTHVIVERFTEEKKVRNIDARVFVERSSQRAILLGHRGQTIKRVASEARQDMERLFGGKVFLTVRVQVKSGWMNDARLLRQLDIQ